MNNGLHGRYGPQLEAWNDARQFAGELVEAFFATGKTLQDVVNSWQSRRPNFPSLEKLKGAVSKNVFSPAHRRVNELARMIMNFEGWWR